MTDNANGAWSIDVDVTKKEHREFLAVCKTSIDQSDDTLIYPFLAKYIKAWPYEGDPANPETYDSLKLSQFGEVVKRVQAAFQAISGSA